MTDHIGMKQLPNDPQEAKWLAAHILLDHVKNVSLAQELDNRQYDFTIVKAKTPVEVSYLDMKKKILDLIRKEGGLQ